MPFINHSIVGPQSSELSPRPNDIHHLWNRMRYPYDQTSRSSAHPLLRHDDYSTVSTVGTVLSRWCPPCAPSLGIRSTTQHLVQLRCHTKTSLHFAISYRKSHDIPQANSQEPQADQASTPHKNRVTLSPFGVIQQCLRGLGSLACTASWPVEMQEVTYAAVE
jgi:hypothetical protein